MFDGALKILVAGSEAVPFIKTGGLADVMDAVPRGLAARGHDVTLVLPKYRDLTTAGVEFENKGTVSVPIDGRIETANVLVGSRDRVRVVLLEHPGFFEREGGPYAAKHAALGLSAYDAAGVDDADERFGFYARAALEAVRVLGIKPDVVHAHDWHAALIPALLKSAYKNDPFFAGTKTALTIHNIAFQGAFALASALKVGVDEERLEHNGGANYLKSGIANADVVTTVSPTYAREIVENPMFGMGLEGHLGAHPRIFGIINGIDLELYDPATDPLIARHYGVDDVETGKAANKAALQKKLGLDAAPNAPLFVVAARLAHQKGIDMIFDSARDIVRLGGQLAIMGNGDAETEAARAALVREFPGKIASHPFDEKAVRLLYAGGDFLLMPSRFEPSGLSQLIAQRYGTLPLVTNVGGLADTVSDLRTDPVNGSGLIIPSVASISLSRTIADAVSGYNHPLAFALARRASMLKNSSWKLSLDAYEALFRGLAGRSAPSSIAPADEPEAGAPRPGDVKRRRDRRGGNSLLNSFGKALFLSAMAAAVVPVLWGAAPALKLIYALPIADILALTVLIPLAIGAAAWRRLKPTPLTASQPPPSRRAKLAVAAAAILLGIGIAAVPYRTIGPIVEPVERYVDRGRPAAEQKQARWISGGVVEEEALALLSRNPVGRDMLNQLRDRGGKVRLPAFFVSRQSDSNARYDGPFDGVYLNESAVTSRGWTVEQFLADPALQRRLIQDMELTVFHELTHAMQARRPPWTPGYLSLKNSIQCEQEAFLRTTLYLVAKLEADPNAKNNSTHQWMPIDAAGDFERFLKTVTAMYPANVDRTDPYIDEFLAGQRARWPAYRVHIYQVLAARAQGPALAKMYSDKAAAAAKEAGLPAPQTR